MNETLFKKMGLAKDNTCTLGKKPRRWLVVIEKETQFLIIQLCVLGGVSADGSWREESMFGCRRCHVYE
jgi:hypothetical protein